MSLDYCPATKKEAIALGASHPPSALADHYCLRPEYVALLAGAPKWAADPVLGRWAEGIAYWTPHHAFFLWAAVQDYWRGRDEGNARAFEDTFVLLD